MSDSIRGHFSWHELMTTDIDSAQAFYTAVVGWKTEEWEGGSTPYTMWMSGDATAGGAMALPEDAAAAGAPPHWMAYVATPSLDNTVEQALKLGATLIWGPLEVGGEGRVAGLADPWGAHFAVHEPERVDELPDSPPSTGEFSWHELLTTDAEGSLRFYTHLFGWQPAGDVDLGPEGLYHTFSRGAYPLGGMLDKPEHIPFCHWLLYISVNDLDGALARVQELGGKVLNGPEEVPGGDRIAQCLDPQGAAFALLERA